MFGLPISVWLVFAGLPATVVLVRVLVNYFTRSNRQPENDATHASDQEDGEETYFSEDTIVD